MVERFLLPNRTVVVQPLIDRPGRRSFERLHDSHEREDLRSLPVNQWSHNHVYVVWHDYGDVKFIANSMILATAGQHDVPSDRRQDPS